MLSTELETKEISNRSVHRDQIRHNYEQTHNA